MELLPCVGFEPTTHMFMYMFYYKFMFSHFIISPPHILRYQLAMHIKVIINHHWTNLIRQSCDTTWLQEWRVQEKLYHAISHSHKVISTSLQHTYVHISVLDSNVEAHSYLLTGSCFSRAGKMAVLGGGYGLVWGNAQQQVLGSQISHTEPQFTIQLHAHLIVHPQTGATSQWLMIIPSGSDLMHYH